MNIVVQIKGLDMLRATPSNRFTLTISEMLYQLSNPKQPFSKPYKVSVHVALHDFFCVLKFTEAVLNTLTSEVQGTLDIASKNEYREIKGLEDRLYGLDQLKTETGKILQEQTDLAQVRKVYEYSI